MTSQEFPPFPGGTVEHVCKILAKLHSGTELTRVMAEIPLKHDPGEGITKWRHLAYAVSSNQAGSQTRNATIALVTAVTRPELTLDRIDVAAWRRSRPKLE